MEPSAVVAAAAAAAVTSSSSPSAAKEGGNNDDSVGEARKKRHAEKSRSQSSCAFADHAAVLSVDEYRRLCPAPLQAAYKQTVLSTVLLQIPDSTTSSSSRIVVAGLGVGTKVLSASRIRQERQHSLVRDTGDRCVRDMHAEILARRAFRRFLLEEVQRWQQGEKGKGGHPFLCLGEDRGIRFRPNVSLHLYTSSQPCGNACIKRWATSKRPRVHEGLGKDEVPRETHEPFFVTAKAEGQVALLTKRNDTTKVNILGQNADKKEISGEKLGDETNLLRHESGICYPVGTSPISTGEGNVMTCSDKIARWNALGIQGSLISSLIPIPLYLSSVIVGRKYSEAHCKRALCCRIAKFRLDSAADGVCTFHTHHPAMLGTAVKFDESQLCTDAEGGANFEDFRVFSAWPNSIEDDTSYSIEILDGRTGLLVSEKNVTNSTLSNESEIPEEMISKLSSFSFAILTSELLQKSKSYTELKASSITYQEAKSKLLSDKNLFQGWIKKSYY